jgi:DNA-binding NtrC family response regulator
MPGMNGPQLVDAIKQNQPDIHVIMMSGYTDNVITHQEVLQKTYTLLNKPLLPTTIAVKIRNILDNKQDDPAATKTPFTN